MRVLVIEPHKQPQEMFLERSLKAMQAVVGGPVQFVYPWNNNAVLVCNELGKVFGLEANRELKFLDGEVYDMVHGTFFICEQDGDHLGSISDELLEHYAMEFAL